MEKDKAFFAMMTSRCLCWTNHLEKPAMNAIRERCSTGSGLLGTAS